MIKVLFVCHGNICRSPMAEFVMKDLVAKRGLEADFYIASAATSGEEIGNPVHHGTRNKLNSLGISTKGKCAIRLTKEDYNKYDYLIGMDRYNMTNMQRIVGMNNIEKLSLLMDYTDRPGSIADPWYSGDFDATYEDVLAGCIGLLAHLGYA